MKTSKAAISLALVILMSSLGIVFAGWTDQVYIEGVANMGSLTLAFDNEEPPICTEFHKIDDEGPLITGEYLEKDVAWCEAYYEDLIQDVPQKSTGISSSLSRCITSTLASMCVQHTCYTT